MKQQSLDVSTIYVDKIAGLTDAEAKQRLFQYGRNYITKKRPHNLMLILRKFWAPIPWMLEVTIILQLIIGKIEEAIIITALLIFNSLLSFFQEERANKALTILKKHLAINARVLRDGKWQLITAENLVPDDIIHLRMGDISPADIRIISGNASLDQSVLTGEALPTEGTEGSIVYSGTIIKRGEVTGKVIATGVNTYFGKTVELIQTAKTQSHINNIIFTILKYLVVVSVLLVSMVLVYAFFSKLPLIEIIPYILVLLVASIPVALPATFTLATALGAQLLAKHGVLVTRLSAIEEAAVIDVICLDKTGTITSNKLTLVDLYSYHPYSNEDLLKFALLSSDEATQDPIDAAIFSVARTNGTLITLPMDLRFVPFDSVNKRTEAIFTQNGKIFHILKGSPDIIVDIISKPNNLLQDTSRLAAKGCRVLAVAVSETNNNEKQNKFSLAGLLAFYDPPRNDSMLLIKKLKDMGLRVQMVTGDGLVTAQAIAEQVGIGNRVCHQTMINQEPYNQIFNCDVFAGVFPQDKFTLVKTLQKLGHSTGMTGDGVNDAPALKQAEVGIAVANAVDVAKSAASIVLTQLGLGGIIITVNTSRQIHKRMLTYILNKITKSFEIAIFLSLSVILTKTLIITPLLMVLLLFTNDFVTMSIATDNVSSSPRPEKWHIANLIFGGGILAFLMLLLSFTVFFLGRNFLYLPIEQLQTLVFLLLVFTGQGTIYLVRERRYLWNSLPSKWLMVSSLLDVLVVVILATNGILMAAINPLLIAALLIIVVCYLFVVDLLKVPMFAHLGIV
jgi:H+-transporting ATPase